MNNKERAWIIDALGSAISDGETSLGQVPQLLRKVLENDAWKDFETKMGKHVVYQQHEFKKFVETPPLDGLGADMELIKEIASKDMELQIMLARALRLSKGNPTGNNQHTGGNGTISAISKEKVSQLSIPESEGKSKDEKKKRERYGQNILRLENKSPELYAQVLAGKKTLHAAAIEAKIDHPTMTVTLDSPRSAASLVAKASPEFLEELRKLLFTSEVEPA